jgi:peptide-methionine (R)-S-oxide reductase
MADQINPNLSDHQKRVLFEAETEAPFSGEWLDNKSAGQYTCANCGNKLFDSSAKFDSGCGWPSFYQPYDPKALGLSEDLSHGMQRVEVKCGRCGAHQGHVFNDAPDQPTGLRFCINSAGIDFVKKGRAG